MSNAKLNKTPVEAVVPEDRDVYVWDAALARYGLRVTPAGARFYLVQYRARPAPRQPPKTRRISIGEHGKPWTQEKARDEARRILAEVDRGRDPFADREESLRERQARAEAIAEAEAQKARAEKVRQRDNFEAVAERYIDLCMKTNRSGAETARLLRHGPVPAWKDATLPKSAGSIWRTG